MDNYVNSAARLMAFVTLYWFLQLRCVFSNFTKGLATLYDGAFMLLMTGLIGLSGLCNFILAFSIGAGFFCVRCFILCLSMMRLHCWCVLCMSVWYLLMGSYPPLPKTQYTKTQNRYILQTYGYRHHYQLHIKPSYGTQNSGIQILHFQNAFFTTNS